jgi:hypothetical protein
MRRFQPVNPLGPVLLALAVAIALGAVYWIFGIGKDALVYALAALLFYAVPFVVIFGIAGDRDRRQTSPGVTAAGLLNRNIGGK